MTPAPAAPQHLPDPATPPIPTTSLGPWPDGFDSFTLHHAGSSLVFAGIAFLLIAMAWRWRGTTRGASLEGGIVGGIIVSQVLTMVYWAEPARFVWGTSLPLHMCDIVGWMVPAALLLRSRWLYAVVFFWGLGLTTQAFVQPTLEYGIKHGVYWFFWVQHAGIMLGGLYLWAIRGYRPTAADLGFVAGISAVAGIVTAAVNWRTGWEYFYTGPSTPGNPTIIDHLGAWPGRVVLMWLIAVTAMAVLWGLSIAADRMLSSTPANEPVRTDP